MEKFSRALHLHWLWQDWTVPSKPWAGSDLPCKPANRLQCLNHLVGMVVQLWHHNWLDGEAAKNLALHLFKLVKEKTYGSSKSSITTTVGFACSEDHNEEFVSLWFRVQNI